MNKLIVMAHHQSIGHIYKLTGGQSVVKDVNYETLLYVTYFMCIVHHISYCNKFQPTVFVANIFLLMEFIKTMLTSRSVYSISLYLQNKNINGIFICIVWLDIFRRDKIDII